MNKKKYLRKVIAVSLMASALTFTPQIDYFPIIMSVAHAEIKTYSGVGEGITSDAEAPAMAKLRARADAMQAAKDQAGVYLTGYKKVVDAHLVADEITAITNNIVEEVGETQYEVKTVRVSDKITLIHYKATVKVNIDTDGINKYLERDEKDRVTIVNQNKELQKAVAENNKQVENLRKQAMNTTNESEKTKIKAQFEQVDVEFLANQKNDEGLKLYYQKNYQGAITKYNEALKIKPNFDWAYNNRGTIYLNQQQYERAVQDYNKAISLNPKLSEAYNNRGIVYSNLGQKENAIQNFNKAISLNPKYDMAYNNRGVEYAKLGQHERAIQDYNKAIELNPKLSEAYNNRGSAYDELEQHEKAIADYNKAITLNPKNVKAYYNRCLTYAVIGNFKQAIEDVQKAIAIEPNHADYYQLRGLLYKELGETAKAEADFKKAKQLGYKE